jgi:hypothetical protein
VALDEGSNRSSRFTSQDKGGEDQGFTAPKASISGVVIDSTELRHDCMGECFCSLYLGLRSGFSPYQMWTWTTREGEKVS